MALSFSQFFLFSEHPAAQLPAAGIAAGALVMAFAMITLGPSGSRIFPVKILAATLTAPAARVVDSARTGPAMYGATGGPTMDP